MLDITKDIQSLMRNTKIRVEPAEAFFERGRELACSADRGGRIPPSRVVAFDDFESLLLLLKHERATPGSITDLARMLNQD
jgi:hypothetical protein